MYVKQIVLAQFLLLFLLLQIISVYSIAEAPQPVYKAGDYFTYKVKFSLTTQNQTCTIELIYRIDITRVETPRVYFNNTIKDVKTTGACPPIPGENETNSRWTSIDKKPSEAEELPFLVDPSYSGEYINSTQNPYTGAKAELSLKYSKGVLISGSVSLDYGVLGKESFIIELIDSSVAEFKPSPPIPLYLWIIIRVVVIGAVVGVVFYLLRRRRSRPQPTPPQPQSPPAPQPAPST
jgi:hypothetical protein